MRIFWFICLFERVRENLHPLVHFPERHHGLCWTRPEPGAQSLFSIACVGGRSQTAHVPGVSVRSRTSCRATGTQTSTLIWGALLFLPSRLTPILSFTCQVVEGFQNRHFPLAGEGKEGTLWEALGWELDLSGEPYGSRHWLSQNL